MALADAALRGGAPAIQVRLKSDTDAARYELATAIAQRCRGAGALCIVNDRVDLALAAGADGVHLGSADLPVDAARRLVPSTFVIGGTARDADTGQRLVGLGADYLGVGPAYVTSSKSGLPDPIGPAGVAAVAAAVSVPVVAIGGITADAVPELLAAGAHGVAVIGAVGAAPDPTVATAVIVGAVNAATAEGAVP